VDPQNDDIIDPSKKESSLFKGSIDSKYDVKNRVEEKRISIYNDIWAILFKMSLYIMVFMVMVIATAIILQDYKDQFGCKS